MENVDTHLVELWLKDFKQKTDIETKDAMLAVALKESSEETIKAMTESGVKTHVKLIDEEIKETEGTISNENIWLKGSSTEEERHLHSHNIATLSVYVMKLKELKDE